MNKLFRQGLSAVLSVMVLGQALPVSYAAASDREQGSVSITEQAFPDQKFRQWLTDSSNIHGYGADGVLTTAELAGISEINVSGIGVRSLQGIEHFTALEQLDCKNNALTQLDVQNNRSLKYLHCAFNSIASLDVSGLDQLISLNCESNQMTSLDLTGCTALEIIYCRNNNLPKVDFSTNTALKFIETFDNKLKEVDLSNLKQLEFVHLDHNLLTHLDLSANTNLSPVGSGFVARNNQLDTLTLPVKATLIVEDSVYAEQDPKKGYERTEWYLDDAFTQPATSEIVANGQTLYVKWLPNDYTISFSGNGGSGSMTAVPAVWDTPVELPKSTFSRVGYRFAGWEDTFGDGAKYTDQQTVTNLAGEIQGDRVTLYAQWQPITYTVAFDANGGQGEMQPETHTYNQSKTLSSNTIQAPAGKEFAGWARQKNGPVLYADGASVRNLTATQDETITLYAIWREPIVNQYRDALDQAFAAYQADQYTEQDWSQLAGIYDEATRNLAGTVEESQMQDILAIAKNAMAAVPTIAMRVKQAVSAWETAYRTVIAQASGGAVDEANAQEIGAAAQAAAVGLTTDFVAANSDLTIAADRELVTARALQEIETTVQALQKLADAAAWAGGLDGLSTRALSEVTSQWQANYETAYQQAGAYQAQLSAGLMNALQVRASLALQKQQAVTQLHMDYSGLDREQYTEENLRKLDSIFQSGTDGIEAADSNGAVAALLAKAQEELRAVPDKNQTEKPGGGESGESGEGGAGGGVSGGGTAGGGGAAGGGAGGGGTAPGPSDQVSSEQTIAATVTVDTSAGTAKAQLDAADVKKKVDAALQAAQKDQSAPVITVTMDSNAAKTVSLSVPSQALGELAGNAKAVFSVRCGLGKVTLNAKAIQAVVQQAGQDAFVLTISSVTEEGQNNCPGYDISIQSVGKKITDLSGGTAVAAVPYTLGADQQAGGVIAYAVAEDGGRSACSTTYDRKTQTVQFTLHQLSRVVIEYDETAAWQGSFADVKATDWFYDAVRYVCAHGIMNGHSATAFGPEENLSRAQLAQVLYNMEDRPETVHAEYSDVTPGAWYENAINWAVSNHILTGYGDGLMGPDDAVTREQLAAMLYRYSGLKGYGTDNRADLSGFADASQVSAYAQIPMQWANAEGIINGTSATELTPGGNATRAQTAAMLMRFVQKQDQ